MGWDQYWISRHLEGLLKTNITLDIIIIEQSVEIIDQKNKKNKIYK